MTHPTEDQLRRLLADDVASECRDVLEAHVNRCEECLTRLEGMRRGRPDDLRLLVSRPALAPGDGFPAEGSGFEGWRASAINLPGGATDGTTQVTAHAVCLSDTPGIP